MVATENTTQIITTYNKIIYTRADHSSRVVEGMVLWELFCWECGFQSGRGHGCLSVVSVVCCQAEVSDSSPLLVQRSPTDCGVSECDREASIVRRLWPTGSCWVKEKILIDGINCSDSDSYYDVNCEETEGYKMASVHYFVQWPGLREWGIKSTLYYIMLVTVLVHYVIP